MSDYIYVMFNKKSNRYESVMSFPSDSMAIYRLSKAVDPDLYDVCRIGKINIETGECETSAPVRLILEVSEKLPVSEAK